MILSILAIAGVIVIAVTLLIKKGSKPDSKP